MSDGPLYSLKARPKWKRAAKLASNDVTSREDVRDITAEAILSDCKYEHVSDALAEISALLADDQEHLFERDRAEKLSQIGEQYGAYDLPCRIAEFIQDELRSGMPSQVAMENGIYNALVEKADREVRSIEEHYLREGHSYRGRSLCARMDQAIADLPMKDIVRGLVNPGSGVQLPRYRKKNELGEGVPL